eukprot:1152806-Pelagomonas_calceolata.AAC.1
MLALLYSYATDIKHPGGVQDTWLAWCPFAWYARLDKGEAGWNSFNKCLLGHQSRCWKMCPGSPS